MATRASSRRVAVPSTPADALTAQQASPTAKSRVTDNSESERPSSSGRRKAGRPRRDATTAPAVAPAQDLNSLASKSPGRMAGTAKPKGRKSSGVASAISGTTARTSLTDQELAEMYSEGMIDQLPDLAHTSELILDQLAPANISVQTITKLARELKDPGVRISKNLKKNRTELNENKQKYGNGPLINVSVAVRGILGVRTVDELSQGLWRPDEIFHKANLASSVESIYARLASDSPELPLEKLDRDFPEPYLSRLVTGGAGIVGASSLFKETFDLALEIRTQFALQVFRNQVEEPSFDPERILTQIFYEDETDVRGWDVDGLRANMLKSTQRQAIAKRIQDIKARINTNTDAHEPVDLNALNETYPLTTFLQKFMLWSRSRVFELDKRINNAGKPAGIQSAIESEIRRRQAIMAGRRQEGDSIQLKYEHSPSEQLIPQPQPGTSNIASSGMKHLKNLKKLNQQQQHTHQHNFTAQRPANNPAPTAPMFANFDLTNDVPIDPQLMGDQPLEPGHVQTGLGPGTDFTQQLAQAAVGALNDPGFLQEIVKQHTQETAEANKENDPVASTSARDFLQGPSLMNRQPNATRVQWDTQPDFDPTSGDIPILPLSTAAEDDDDNAFETDVRQPPPPPPATKGRKRARNGTGPAAKRQRFQEINTPSSSIGPPSASPYPSSLPQSIDGFPEEIRPYYAANHTAKQETARLKQNKPPQKRRPWSPQETALLQTLIEEIGTSWASIKKWDDAHDVVFETRDQVALKDKARNMKFDILKAHSTLPRNFELIPLKASQKEDLRSHGVDVDAIHAAIAAAAAEAGTNQQG